MTGFTTLRSRAAHLPEDNVDTDVIFPARFLLLMDRDGLGPYLFHDRRFDARGDRRPGFVLDDPTFAEARILIAGDGFGCGSSREQAVWALVGHGIGCVIAPSFGEIFAANCVKNGLLTITLPREQVAALGARAAAGETFEVDLDQRTLRVDGEKVAGIDIAEADRTMLLNGWDETDVIVREDGDAIETFEARHRVAQPWLFQDR
ncbi:3-isopropylmalate/(R)-2-methylmalate dehydratase small subunit [Amorphus suaedae]